jgi:hypothetical protein
MESTIRSFRNMRSDWRGFMSSCCKPLICPASLCYCIEVVWQGWQRISNLFISLSFSRSNHILVFQLHRYSSFCKVSSVRHGVHLKNECYKIRPCSYFRAKFCSAENDQMHEFRHGNSPSYCRGANSYRWSFAGERNSTLRYEQSLKFFIKKKSLAKACIETYEETWVRLNKNLQVYLN